jgi:hypothetical protein
MGAYNQERASISFYKISEGKFVTKIDGVEHSFTHMAGKLQGIVIKKEDVKFGPELHIHLMDNDGEYMIIQTRLAGGYSRDFFKKIVSVFKAGTIEQEIVFGAKYEIKEINGKELKTSQLFLSQNSIVDDTPKHFSSAWKGSNDLPQPEEDLSGNKNFTKQLIFMIDVFKKDIEPRLPGVRAKSGASIPAPAPAQPTEYKPAFSQNLAQKMREAGTVEESLDTVDDLPF